MPYYDPNAVIPNILSNEIATDLTQDDPSQQSPDINIITDACNDASDLIDSYCAKAYQVPFNPVPNVIQEACATIVGYLLFKRRVSSGQVNKFQDDYDRVTKWLTLISQGKVKINAATVGEPVNTGGAVFQSPGERGTVFTDDSLRRA